jgi:hypothetical protein
VGVVVVVVVVDGATVAVVVVVVEGLVVVVLGGVVVVVVVLGGVVVVVVVLGGVVVVVVVDVVVVVAGDASVTASALGYVATPYANHISSPESLATTAFTANERPGAKECDTDPKLMVRDTQPDEPALHLSRRIDPESITLQSSPDVAQSSKYASTSPSFDSSKSFIALQKVSDACPSRSRPVEGPIQIWYLEGSVSPTPLLVFLSVNPGSSSRPAS